MVINPYKYYSLTEVCKLGEEGFFPVKSRQSLLAYIHSGDLKAFENSAQGKKPSYMIQGSELLAFLESSSSLLEVQNVNRGRRKKEKSKST